MRGFPHRSDAGIRTTVRVCHLGARTPSPSMDRRHDQSDGGNGWPARLPKPFLGTLFRAFSSVTMMVPMARRSLGGFEQWAFAIAPSRLDHHGRMDTLNVRSGRSAVNASTM